MTTDTMYNPKPNNLTGIAVANVEKLLLFLTYTRDLFNEDPSIKHFHCA
jgi:hypothetical protein